MKAFVKAIIAGGVILVVGIAVVLIALGVSGWQIDGDYEMKEYECVDNNSTLDIDFSAGTLEINYYDGDKIKIEYPQSKILSSTVAEADGTLSFTTSIKRNWSFVGWFMNNTPTAKIWIPQGEVMDIQLNMNAGTVKLADGQLGNFAISMNAGTFSTGDIECKKFSVELNAGTLNAQNVVSAQDVRIDLSAGNMDVKSLECPAVVGNVNAGRVNINKLQTASVDFDISAGSVKLGMVGAKSDYNVAIEKSAGTCNISNQIGTKDLKIKASISAGTFTVNFGA